MRYIVILILFFCAGTAFAENQGLTLEGHGTLAAKNLMARKDAAKITIKDDPFYHKATTYQAVPMAALLHDMGADPDDTIEAVAADGFVASLPAKLLLAENEKSARAWLAIEPASTPWPPLPGKKDSAGPFAVIWQRPQASGIRSEQWPYQVVALRIARSMLDRPELAIAGDVAENSPIRAGQKLFVTQCMSCHQFNGAGAAKVGPDLNRPASPVEYFKTTALKAYIRNPAALRHWDGMQMPGFGKDALSDRDIDDIIAYLDYMAPRKQP